MPTSGLAREHRSRSTRECNARLPSTELGNTHKALPKRGLCRMAHLLLQAPISLIASTGVSALLLSAGRRLFDVSADCLPGFGATDSNLLAFPIARGIVDVTFGVQRDAEGDIYQAGRMTT